MISKADFVKYCERVQKTEKGILQIEKAFGDICLREHDFCCLPNYADKIAAMLLGIPNGWMESFVEDFWKIIDGEISEVFITYPDGSEKTFTIEGSDGLYDYWRKEIEGNDD